MLRVCLWEPAQAGFAAEHVGAASAASACYT